MGKKSVVSSGMSPNKDLAVAFDLDQNLNKPQ